MRDAHPPQSATRPLRNFHRPRQIILIITEFAGGFCDAADAAWLRFTIRLSTISFDDERTSGIATHISEVPQATAYNLFFEGFENQTQLSKFWYPSVIKGWEGRFSTNTTLGGGAEHLEDHGLFFHDEDVRYGMYQPFNSEVKYRPLNYKLEYNPLFNSTVVSC